MGRPCKSSPGLTPKCCRTVGNRSRMLCSSSKLALGSPVPCAMSRLYRCGCRNDRRAMDGEPHREQPGSSSLTRRFDTVAVGAPGYDQVRNNVSARGGRISILVGSYYIPGDRGSRFLFSESRNKGLELQAYLRSIGTWIDYAATFPAT